MFGYVLPYKPELKIKDYEIFKAYYCGLCRSIKNNFGNIPRLSLNYDMTFVAILLDGLNETPGDFYLDTCLIHPLKKRMIIKDNKALIYSAYLNVALTYYKICDDAEDDKTIKDHLYKYIFKGYKDNFSKKYKDLDNILKKRLSDLSLYEKELNNASLDEISEPFSRLTAEVISAFYKDEETLDIQSLYNLGYNLGKWIYLMDALDDLKVDMEKNKFNPLSAIFNKDSLPFEEFYISIKDRIEFNILTCANGVIDNYKRLRILKNNDIIENILKLGLMDRLNLIEKKYNSK
ncbi:DUF5685 family protein [Alloiococcus sp. CFN-8]|uniref:DUF5685 family protein n=1 Tax=Alloiococcus sp. CFN-8 TaxID=3416081 RepID=UPI003CF2FBCF